MDPLILGTLVAIATIALLFSGISVAIGLLVVSTVFLLIFDGTRSMPLLPELLFGDLNSFALLSIPMFIIMGASIASTRAGADLYEALDRWLTRVPGGLVISNLGACALFAAMSGSSPATCAAIGKMGIPEMRKRGYPDSVAAGSIAAGGTLGILIPPSVTMIVYGIATETSIGRLFLAGVVPGILLVGLFMAWALYDTWRKGSMDALAGRTFTWEQRLEVLPKVLPFLAIIFGVLYALYGGDGIVTKGVENAGIDQAGCHAHIAKQGEHARRPVRPSHACPASRCKHGTHRLVFAAIQDADSRGA